MQTANSVGRSVVLNRSGAASKTTLVSKCLLECNTPRSPLRFEHIKWGVGFTVLSLALHPAIHLTYLDDGVGAGLGLARGSSSCPIFLPVIASASVQAFSIAERIISDNTSSMLCVLQSAIAPCQRSYSSLSIRADIDVLD